MVELVDLDTEAGRDSVRLPRSPDVVVRVGWSATELSEAQAALASRLTLTIAPAGPGRSWVSGSEEDVDLIRRRVVACQDAARTLTRLLSRRSTGDVESDVCAESLAYSRLLDGPEFGRWLAARPPRMVPDAAPDCVVVSRKDDRLSVALNRPERHNALGVAVREGLLDGLAVAEIDDTIRRVVLCGRGPSFCSGGDLDEFGQASDQVQAHLVRMSRHPGLAVHRLKDRVVPRLHGSCIGAGIEVPAFAAHVEAHENATFCLPELALGLVPGAGGTVSITRRIGRWRTAYLVLTGRSIDGRTAHDWGLVDELL